MSPRGVVMFYGATDEATALAEVRYDPTAHTASVGRFVTTEPMTCLDLCAALPLPSLFDFRYCHMREDLIFLNRFIAEISKASNGEDPLE